ncbi:hypothetical protein DMS41_04945 [Salmonella enterica]|uniref:Uncharacterized protein n=1 Tax=Salmonella enterica subsp. enterica serovar Adelaide TaxID=29473 RepID=A0A5Z9VAF1_SALET|nr:hypothetical protein [Salmonella enterica subsp. enterica serovar Lexington]EAA6408085.1 hypothetical protein [Salmonella enterica subsp. enterica serovar Moroto]EAA7336839.1 hypothetical protein [Salmonella enterica subsp. enterica]EAA7889000.1 hypothetical protein [Salmonella enterica]EAM3826318.1 hypothetical protein [Salmonella enterica subsp. enterica serovar Adelaide]EBH8623352.1 hypothetical protein [Salmonella enterica subsp. enterica serovar Tees]ECV3495344.1 hypothetical protein 
MFAIRPNDFYRCIMSPNMMLARTRPLPIQQGPFFLLHISSHSSVGRLAHPRHVATYVPGDLLRCRLAAI